ncbi:MAG TPA: DNA-3-methyladenine glycosylase, partial [Solirubrobacteraceae bacterium]|nr:DNA-3-methyladenine glycosylase [Solirubrobacteraceae bacterium]
MNRAFYDRPVLDVARDLVGCTLAHGDCAGVVVETEAYHFTEPACHAYVGVTPRTEVLWGPPGVAYVYRSYGIHALLNAVCEPDGVGAAVLIRAIEPTEGLEVMRARRGPVPDRELCNGPGKLTQALGIGLDLNGTSLLGDGPILFGPRPAPAEVVRSAPRIGISRAADLDWRFTLAGSPHVSRPFPK